MRASTMDRLLTSFEAVANKMTGEWLFGIGLVIVALPIGCGLGAWGACNGLVRIMEAW